MDKRAYFAQTSFVAGAGGASDELRVIAYDGRTYSNNSIFARFNVDVASAAGPVAGGGQPNDNFVFATDFGQKAVIFNPAAADIYAFEAPADHFNHIYGEIFTALERRTLACRTQRLSTEHFVF